jgi:steroid 5-alpha reductase family enzyme
MRHPNYLGEIMLWWLVYFMLISLDITYWWTFIGALANTLMFVFISIPLMEQRQMVQKPAYRDYVNSTPKLLPISGRIFGE